MFYSIKLHIRIERKPVVASRPRLSGWKFWFDYYPGNQPNFFLEVAFPLRLKLVINYQNFD